MEGARLYPTSTGSSAIGKHILLLMLTVSRPGLAAAITPKTPVTIAAKPRGSHQGWQQCVPSAGLGPTERVGLIVVGDAFTGTSTLMSLLRQSPGITTACSAGS